MIQTQKKYPEAGNWHELESFCWFERPDDADEFCIYHLNHRDSGLLDQSNADATRKALEPFDDDVRLETFSHWAVGWIDAVAVRVETRAYRTLCDIIDQLSEYPILDETDYSERECEATLENIREEILYIVGEDMLGPILPDGFEVEIVHWLDNSDKYSNETENLDDQGGYPSNESLVAAVSALWPKAIGTKNG